MNKIKDLAFALAVSALLFVLWVGLTARLITIALKGELDAETVREMSEV